MPTPKRNPKCVRMALAMMLARRQDECCARCGGFINAQFGDIDHITPLAQGGTWDPDNLQLLHKGCHDEKTVEDLRELLRAASVGG